MWISAALAAPPTLDEPLRTGASAPGDAALVVGIEDYLIVADVPYASRDARAFHDWLVYSHGVPAARVELLDRGASKEQLEAALERLGAAVTGDGTAWVYFAGHGAADPSTGERLLLGDDVRQDPTVFASRAVPLARVEALAARGGGTVVMVVDACYGGVGRSGQELVPGKRFAVPSWAHEPAARSIAWHAAGPDELSGPLDVVRHGAFTYFAIGALRGWADGERDGVRDGQVTVEEAQLYVARALATVQVRSQRPVLVAAEPGRVLSGASEAGPSLAAADFAPAAAAAPAPAPVPVPVPVAPSDTTKLCFARTSQMVSSMGAVKITADGADLVRLGLGEKACVEIAPGRHLLEARVLGDKGELLVDVPAGVTSMVQVRMVLAGLTTKVVLEPVQATSLD